MGPSNVSTEGKHLIVNDELFQIAVAARSSWSEDLEVEREQRSSETYWWTTTKRTLYSNLYLTESQCRDARTGDIIDNGLYIKKSGK